MGKAFFLIGLLIVSFSLAMGQQPVPAKCNFKVYTYSQPRPVYRLCGLPVAPNCGTLCSLHCNSPVSNTGVMHKLLATGDEAYRGRTPGNRKVREMRWFESNYVNRRQQNLFAVMTDAANADNKYR